MQLSHQVKQDDKCQASRGLAWHSDGAQFHGLAITAVFFEHGRVYLLTTYRMFVMFCRPVCSVKNNKILIMCCFTLHTTRGLPVASGGQLIQNTCGFKTMTFSNCGEPWKPITDPCDKHRINLKITSLMAFPKKFWTSHMLYEMYGRGVKSVGVIKIFWYFFGISLFIILICAAASQDRLSELIQTNHAQCLCEVTDPSAGSPTKKKDTPLNAAAPPPEDYPHK